MQILGLYLCFQLASFISYGFAISVKKIPNCEEDSFANALFSWGIYNLIMNVILIAIGLVYWKVQKRILLIANLMIGWFWGATFIWIYFLGLIDFANQQNSSCMQTKIFPIAINIFVYQGFMILAGCGILLYLGLTGRLGMLDLTCR